MPGVLDSIIAGAPLLTPIVVVGVCVEPESFRPVMAVDEEVELRFASCYDPVEFHETLQMLASGEVDPSR